MVKVIVEKEYLEHNGKAIRAHVGDAKIIGVAKGNGYGLGLVPLAQEMLCCGADMLAVSLLEDGLKLRKAGIGGDIILLMPLYNESDIRDALKNNITLGVGSEKSAQLADKLANELGITAQAHIIIDTGFGRFGFMPGDAERIYSALHKLDNLKITGIFSHLYDTFGKSTKNAYAQFSAFTGVCDKLKTLGLDVGLRHLANSCGLIRFPDMHLDAVRAGSAFLGRVACENTLGLKRVGRVFARVDEIRTLPKGHNVAYFSGYKTKRETRAAVICTGYTYGFGTEYADDAITFKDSLRYIYRDVRGLLRRRGMYVMLNGKQCPVMGMVGVCTIIVDVTDVNCNIGDMAELPMKTMLVDSDVEREYV